MVPPDRIALGQRRAQRPLIDFGRQKQLIIRRRDRERCAARMPARDGPVAEPAQPRTRPMNPCAPGREQGIIVGHDYLEHRPRGSKKQIAAGEAPRILKGQLERRAQSSLSGAMRIPRSSRISPSRLKSAATSAAAAVPPALALPLAGGGAEG